MALDYSIESFKISPLGQTYRYRIKKGDFSARETLPSYIVYDIY